MAKKIALIRTAALLGGLVFAFGTAPANALTFTETAGGPNSGIIAQVNGAVFGSDGEIVFNPLNFVSPVSDFIILPTLITRWTLSPSSLGWENVTGNTWVLPSIIPGCGSENEPTCEAAGIWTNPTALSAGDLGVVTFLESDGVTVSDVITFANLTGGGAQITFQSDPSIVPLPAALSLFATGLGALGLLGWRRKQKAQAGA